MDSNRSTISSLFFAFVIAAAVVAAASYFLPSANISARLNAQTTAKKSKPFMLRSYRRR